MRFWAVYELFSKEPAIIWCQHIQKKNGGKPSYSILIDLKSIALGQQKLKISKLIFVKVSSSLLKVCLSVPCLSLGFTLSVQICLSEFPLEWVSVLAIVREYVWVSVGAYAYFQI